MENTDAPAVKPVENMVAQSATAATKVAKPNKMMIFLVALTFVGFMCGGLLGLLLGMNLDGDDSADDTDMITETVVPTEALDDSEPPTPSESPSSGDGTGAPSCLDRSYTKPFGGFYEMTFSVVCNQNVYISSNFETGMTAYVNSSYVNFIYATDASPGYIAINVGEPGTDFHDSIKSGYDSTTGTEFTNSVGTTMFRETSSGPLGDYTTIYGTVNLGGTDYYFQVSYDGLTSTPEIDKVVDTLEFN